MAGFISHKHNIAFYARQYLITVSEEYEVAGLIWCHMYSDEVAKTSWVGTQKS